jgi:16S rRNA (cytidine1402-2'-O)-methyltransferase
MGDRRRPGRALSVLYIVATPIGNLEDVTLRSLRVLREVTAIAAEDTRVTARLLARHQIRRPMISYRAPVEGRALPKLLQTLAAGDVALVSDAGTPTVSDPGQRLVAAAWEAGHRVVPVPGPSAVTAAVAASGFAGAGFLFVGYLPRKPGELRRLLEAIAAERRPVVAFESPHRVTRSLRAIAAALPEHLLLLARELTKLHEEILRGTATEVLDRLGDRGRGEFTVVISPLE